ncbi:heterokaryon incompatibility protein-domain-containing protein [Lophiotrema nucula]|uniref:Heterokaryon incompatibility protein-domain-containing protein n=1 Tax=Lophiotrema nucula TaxID=690887 RepID=A0A6A5ZTX5_9PLEO|nr:heterokaryon incompatibility protein-domain-containing protein [Lophiotrema nucula]
MDLTAASRKLYRPIKPYQTRLLRLHGEAGASDSPLRCDLYHANILHPKFEGLGVFAPSDDGKDDFITCYDALSYTWGNGELTRSVGCNEDRFPITENLYEALLALRLPQEEVRYLWVDAICINQSNGNEKSEQIWNMLDIFRKAARVVVWLGSATEDFERVLFAREHSKKQPSSAYDEYSIVSLFRGLSELYEKAWFTRIWVQQEIFAARKLVFYCGKLQFKWSSTLSKPSELFKLPVLSSAHSYSGHSEEISRLDKLATQRLTCFEQFSHPKAGQLDLIELFLHTGGLGATNPKDHIYGIVGMANMPTKAMSLDEWMTHRVQEVFIPIDYSADLVSILCAVTWATLMKGGLYVLAKFKVLTTDDQSQEPLLPSWVIDWRLAARWFSKAPSSYLFEADRKMQDADIRLDNAWAALVERHLLGCKPKPYKPPPEHTEFCRDNRDGAGCYTELILRGVINPEFYAKKKCVWHKRKWMSDQEAWKLPFEVHATDVVVYMLVFPGGGLNRYIPRVERDPTMFSINYNYNGRGIREHRPGGLWLLRPAEDGKFRLLAFLSFASINRLPFYHRWCWDSEHSSSPPVRTFDRLARDPVKNWGGKSLPNMNRDEWDIRTFTII